MADTLLSIFKKYKAQKPTAYGTLYTQLFEDIRNDELTLLEIGVAAGYSMLSWCEYFPNALIFGIDKNPVVHNVDRATIFVGKQGDAVFLRDSVSKIGMLDIVIDDGSHRTEDQIASLRVLLSCVRPRGYYIIEDLFKGENQQRVVEYLDSIHAVYRLRDTDTATESVCIIEVQK